MIYKRITYITTLFVLVAPLFSFLILEMHDNVTVELPETNSLRLIVDYDPRFIVLTVDPTGKVTYDDGELDYNLLDNVIKDFGEDIPVRLFIDKSCELKHVRNVIDRLHAKGFNRFLIAVRTGLSQVEFISTNFDRKGTEPGETRLHVTIKNDTYINFNGKDITKSDLTDFMITIADNDPDTPCEIIIDDRSHHESLVNLMYIIKIEAGLLNLRVKKD